MPMGMAVSASEFYSFVSSYVKAMVYQRFFAFLLQIFEIHFLNLVLPECGCITHIFGAILE